MKLAAYLKDQDITIAMLASRLGVRVQTIYRYLDGERVPRPELMVRISELTWGKVQPNDWVFPAKRRRRQPRGEAAVQDELNRLEDAPEAR